MSSLTLPGTLNLGSSPPSFVTQTMPPDAGITSTNTALRDQSISRASSLSTEKYITDYYSGSQVALWMGPVWLDDVDMIEFTQSQQKMPFYGYKSQKFDTVAKGTQIIQGAFSVVYSHTNWLNMCVSKYLEYLGPSQTTGLTQNDIDAFVDQVKAGNVDLTTLTIGSTTPGASGIVPYITSAQQDAFSAAGFDQKTAALVNTFWQPVAGSAAAAYKVISPDNLPPFDITITFGNYPKDRPEAQDEFQSSHTVKVLSNVEITGYSMQIAITGEPIQEVYAFIARAMDQPLTRTAKVLTMVSDVKAGINNPS